MNTTEQLAYAPMGRADLLSGDVWYVPIRHHSPACARAVEVIVERANPFAVLVEGPPSFDDLIDLLVHPDARAPLAVYSWVVLDAPALADGHSDSPPRFGAYFPLCDYSPELVALRAARRTGARCRFIDLDHATRAAFGDLEEGVGLVDEHIYAFSATLAALVERHGCRDHNELWDHLIEAAALDPDELVEGVAAYGQLARIGAPTSATDIAREEAMAAIIHRVLAERRRAASDRPVVVVTGAYHTMGVRSLVDAGEGELPASSPATLDAGHGLIRFSFDRLDTLSGYASGMPSPGWYQHVWEAERDETTGADGCGGGSAAMAAAATALDAVAALVRRRNGDGQPSTPTLLDAHVHVRLLASLRGRKDPSRSDVLDAITSTFVKGEESIAISDAVLATFTGTTVGRLPPGTPRPPLSEDFDRRAAALGLPLDTIEPRTVELDLYRSADHRDRSRFLHGLTALGVAYAVPRQQPRYSPGSGRDVLREIWECRFSATTDMSLTEASRWGASIQEAVAAQLADELRHLVDAHGSSAQLLRLVLHAAQRGVHDAVDDILRRVQAGVSTDPDLHSITTALLEADLLWTARAPLDGPRLHTLPVVGEQLYLRACALIEHLPETGTDQLDERVGDLRDLHHVVRSAEWLTLDDTLFVGALTRQLPRVAPQLRGAIDGLRWRDRVVDDTWVATAVAGHLLGTGEPDGAAAYLRGLIAVARELLWHDPELVRTISTLLLDMNRQEFVDRLPGLRSAFAALAPRETDRVAEQLRLAHGVEASVRISDQSEADLLAAVTRSQQVADRLRADGLAEWVDPHQADGR